MARTEINRYGDELAYDDNGNLIHAKCSDGHEEWFDSDGNLIHIKRSDGTEQWWEGHRTIRKKDYHGVETWYEYDDRGKVIYEKHSSAFGVFETWMERDSNGNLIHWWDSAGREVWYEHYENGNLRHYKNSYGHEAWYDPQGRFMPQKEIWK